MILERAVSISQSHDDTIYEAATSMIAASELTFDAALTAYRSGAGSITEVMLAETQLLQARIASTEAHGATLSAAASLALATGAMDAESPAGNAPASP